MVKRIGRYTIESELGHGAFGRVYRAFDPNLKLCVAIKVLIAEDDPELLIRFQAEARATAGLLHPNIVTLYEFSEHEGRPYLVMELLEGQTLQDVIGKPLGLLDKVEIMYQVAEGLRHAHARGVIHRDMKPGNIMVLRDGVTKILDFGIARLLDRDGTRRSRQGDFAGTIPYMAPELFHGIDADKLADIFAYGVIFYELLTGQQPFYAKDPGTVMYRITTYEPPPLRETVPEVPQALENLVRRLIAKERELRVEKMEDVVFDVQPILQQLRQGRAAVIADEIRPFIETGDLDGSKTRIEQVLKLDPLHAEARQWREQLQSQSQRHALRARAEKLLQKGNEDMEARRFVEAVQCFETALRLDSSQTQAVSLLEQAKAMLARARGAARLVAEARAELQQAQIDNAYEKASEAMKLDPGNREAVHLCKDLSRHIRDRRTDELIGRAEELRSLGLHEEALAALTELEAVIAALPRATRLREGIEADRAEVARRRSSAEFSGALITAREALSALRFQEAEEAAQALCSRFPNQPSATDFLGEVRERWDAQRRLDAIGAIMQSARALIRQKRFEDARTALEDGLRAYPGDANLQRLIDTAIAMASAQQRAEAIQGVVKHANSLRDNGELERALEIIDAAVGQFGPESVLVECKRNLEFEREQRDYAFGLDKVLAEARLLLENDRPADAVTVLEDVLSRYPGEPELVRTLASAREAVAALREQESLRETRARIVGLETAGQFDEGLAEMEVALKRYSSDPELLAAAERLRERLRERERGRALAVLVGKIETAVRARNWSGASASLSAALIEFPGDPSLGHFWAAIQEGRHRDELVALESGVRVSFSREDFESALEQMASARDKFHQEATWRSLWKELERLLLATGGRLAETVGLLERAAARHPDDPEVAQALDSARQVFAAWRDQESVRQAQKQIAALESAGKYDEALAQAELAQARHEREPALAAAVRRLRDRVREQKRSRALATAIAKIKGWIAAGDWDRASENLDAAKVEFGADPALVDFPVVIREGRSRAEATKLDTRVRESLAGNDFKGAIEQLAITQAALSQEAAWQTLWRELERSLLADESRLAESIALLEDVASRYPGSSVLAQSRESVIAAQEYAATQRRRRLEQELSVCRDLVKAGKYDQAEPRLELLLPELAEAAAVLAELEAGRRRREQAAAIEQIRSKAQRLLNDGDFDAALKVLDAGLATYPKEPVLDELRESVIATRLRRIIQHQDRQEKISRHRDVIDRALRANDWQGTRERLERARKEFPSEADWNALQSKADEQKRLADLELLETEVRQYFERRDFDQAERRLASQHATLSEDPRWQTLKQELRRQRGYETALQLAQRARSNKQFEEAERILAEAIAQVAPDQRAAALLETVSSERAVKERSERISKGLVGIKRLASVDLPGAIAAAETLLNEFPDADSIAKELHRLRKRRFDTEGADRPRRSVSPQSALISKPAIMAYGAIVIVLLIWGIRFVLNRPANDSQVGQNGAATDVDKAAAEKAAAKKAAADKAAADKAAADKAAADKAAADKAAADKAAADKAAADKAAADKAAADKAAADKAAADKAAADKAAADKAAADKAAADKAAADKAAADKAAADKAAADKAEKDRKAEVQAKKDEEEIRQEAETRRTWAKAVRGDLVCQFDLTGVFEIVDNKNSRGSLRKGTLPGIEVTISPSAEFELVDRPNLKNHWKGLMIKRTGARLSEVSVHWDVKK